MLANAYIQCVWRYEDAFQIINWVKFTNIITERVFVEYIHFIMIANHALLNLPFLWNEFQYDIVHSNNMTQNH